MSIERFNFRKLMKNKLRYSLKTVKCSPYEDQVAALNALIEFKSHELHIINEQLMCYHKLLDFTLDYEGSYTNENMDVDQSSKVLPIHHCQGNMINARVFQSMNIRRCNNLCLLKKDAYEKLRKTELMMGDLECRMSLIREEMISIRETISHITD